MAMDEDALIIPEFTINVRMSSVIETHSRSINKFSDYWPYDYLSAPDRTGGRGDGSETIYCHGDGEGSGSGYGFGDGYGGGGLDTA